MSGSNKKKKKHIGRRDLKGVSKGYIQIDGMIIFDEYEAGKFQISEHIYIAIFNQFKRDDANTISLQIDSLKLRGMIAALEALIHSPAEYKNDWRIFSGNQNPKLISLAHNTRSKQNNDKKEVEVDTYFINFKDTNKALGMAYDIYQIKAIIDMLNNFCDDIEKRVNSETEKISTIN